MARSHYGTGGKLNYALLNTYNPPKRDTQAVPQVLRMAGMGCRRLRQAMGGMSGGNGRTRFQPQYHGSHERSGLLVYGQLGGAPLQGRQPCWLT